MKKSTIARTGVLVRVGIIVVVTAACLYNFVIVKMNRAAELDRSIDGIANEVQTNLRALKSARRLLEIEEREHREWEDSVLDTIPMEPRVNDILDSLGTTATDVGLKVRNSYASEEEMISDAKGKKRKKSAKGKDAFYRIPVTIEVTGGWSQIATYLGNVRELPRQIRLTEVSVTRKTDFFPQAYAKISMEAFYCLRSGEADSSN